METNNSHNVTKKPLQPNIMENHLPELLMDMRKRDYYCSVVYLPASYVYIIEATDSEGKLLIESIRTTDRKKAESTFNNLVGQRSENVLTHLACARKILNMNDWCYINLVNQTSSID